MGYGKDQIINFVSGIGGQKLGGLGGAALATFFLGPAAAPAGYLIGSGVGGFGSGTAADLYNQNEAVKRGERDSVSLSEAVIPNIVYSIPVPGSGLIGGIENTLLRYGAKGAQLLAEGSGKELINEGVDKGYHRLSEGQDLDPGTLWNENSPKRALMAGGMNVILGGPVSGAMGWAAKTAKQKMQVNAVNEQARQARLGEYQAAQEQNDSMTKAFSEAAAKAREAHLTDQSQVPGQAQVREANIRLGNETGYTTGAPLIDTVIGVKQPPQVDGQMIPGKGYVMPGEPASMADIELYSGQKPESQVGSMTSVIRREPARSRLSPFEAEQRMSPVTAMPETSYESTGIWNAPDSSITGGRSMRTPNVIELPSSMGQSQAPAQNASPMLALPPPKLTQFEAESILAAHQKGQENFVPFDVGDTVSPSRFQQNQSMIKSYEDPLYGQGLADMMGGDTKLSTKPRTWFGNVAQGLQKYVGNKGDKIGQEPLYYQHDQLADDGTIIAKKGEMAHGAAGDLMNRAAKARELFNVTKQNASQFISPEAQKNLGWDKLTPENKKFASRKIVQALEDRENAAEILKGTGFEQYYEAARNAFDSVKQSAELGNRHTVSNYFPHKGPGANEPSMTMDPSTNIDVESNRLKSRTGNSQAIVPDDIFKFMNSDYMSGVLKDLSYKELGNEMTKYKFNPTVQQALRKVVFPEVKQKVWIDKALDKVGEVSYNAFIKNNPKSILRNKEQQYLAEGYVSQEAKDLGELALKSPESFGLDDYINKGYSSKMAEADTEWTGTTEKPSFKDKLAFDYSESQNWKQGRALGFAEGVVQTPEYKDLLATGMTPEVAFATAIKEPRVMERAMRRGDDLTRFVNLTNEKGFKPDLYETDNPVARQVLRFTRAATGTPEIYYKMMSRSGRESRILSRGFSDEASVVDTARSLRQMKDGIKQQVKNKELSKDVAAKSLQEIDDELRSAEALIDQIEPRDMGKSLKVLAKSYGRNLAINALIGTLVKYKGTFPALEEAGIMEEKDRSGQMEDALVRSAFQSIPVAGSILDTAGHLAGMQSKYPKNYGEMSVDYALGAGANNPTLGILNMMNQIPGRPLSKAGGKLINSMAK